MKFAKSLALNLAFMVLGLAITLFTASFTLVNTVGDRQTVIDWLADGQVYQNVVDSIDDIEFENPDPSDDDGTISITDAQIIKDTSSEVFTADRLEMWANQAINGIYDWLEGETDEPQFTIDISEVKQEFADSISQRLLADYQQRPVCSQQQLIEARNDPFNANCQVPGYDIEPIIAQLKTDIANNDALLGESRFSAQDIKLGDNEQPFYQNAASAPAWYQASKSIPLLSLILVLISALIIVFIPNDIRTGLKKLSNRLIINAIFGAIAIVILVIGVRAVDFSAGEEGNEVANKIAKPLVEQMTADFVFYGAIVSIAILLIAVAIKLYLRFVKPAKPTKEDPGVISLD